MSAGDGKFIYVPHVLRFASVLFLLLWQINSLSDFEFIGITTRDLYARTVTKEYESVTTERQHNYEKITEK